MLQTHFWRDFPHKKALITNNTIILNRLTLNARTLIYPICATYSCITKTRRNTMLNKTLLVISDKFNAFTRQRDVITISDLSILLNSKTIVLPKSGKICLIPGQGIGEKSIKEILSKAAVSKNCLYFDFSIWHNIPKRASTQLTHKHNIENILISEPHKQTKDTFFMDLLIDEECEIMQDHQTGLHLQGMLLVEAARQAYLATIEKFYTKQDTERNYFVFNKLNTEYCKFLFPLPSSIHVTHEKVDFSNKKRQHTISKIRIIQCGEVSACVTMDVTIMPNMRVVNMEKRLACQALNQLITYNEENTNNYINRDFLHA